MLILIIAACAADSQSASTPCEIEARILYPDGLLHSQPCVSDDECLYGVCHSSPAIASFAFCTKECACGPNSPCNDENGGGWEFVCQQYDGGAWPGESVTSVCTQVCNTVADCPVLYNACERLTGSRKVCLQR